jgi:glycosyltransferase involved in cell wall biosynthesis
VRVALVTHHRLPARGYGGTQRVVVWLARGLRALGHDVRIVAGRGSRLPDLPVETVARRRFRRLYEDPDHDASAWLPRDVDVFHFVRAVAARVPAPHLFTIHGNDEPGADAPNAVFLSEDHRRRHGGRWYVHNGVDPAEYRLGLAKGSAYLFLGKPGRRVKGVDVAERVARRAGVPLVVAGGWRLRWGRRIRWVGPVDGARKAALLAGSRALLFPIRWDEPFGLAVVEAWMSGTPVLAAPRGSMPELFDAAPVGRLCADEDAFVDAVRAIESGAARYDPRACRSYAESRFGHLRMARDYVALYARAVAEGWGR